MPAISINNVTKRFGETRALSSANLEAEFGQIHAIVGENGSGKSTLAKILAGIVPADSGTGDVMGMAPSSPAEAIGLGVSTIFQEMMLAEELPIWENVFAGADTFWRRTSSTAEKKKRTSELLILLSFSDIDPDLLVISVPLFVKQWIVIARALLQNPKVLVFDESSAALDLEATNRLHAEMLRLKEQGTCVVIVTHRIAELVKIADAATVLRDGSTVGCLGRSEMTEENLLRLMSASRYAKKAKTQDTRVVYATHKPALEALNVVAMVGNAPFNFKVLPGQIVGVAGLEGAGQSEFDRAKAGIKQPVNGEEQVWRNSTENVAIESLADAAECRISYVSGDRKREGSFPNLSILENFGMAVSGQYSNRFGLIQRNLLSRAFGVEEERLSIKFASKFDKITTLSGGNQQKVLIARAFAQEPKVIILNDPARGVDIGTKQDLYGHLRDFASDGGAVVYLSTEIEEFFDFADRADVFFEGSLFASFEGDDINEDKILAAMFGQAEPVEFDKDVETGEAVTC